MEADVETFQLKQKKFQNLYSPYPCGILETQELLPRTYFTPNHVCIFVPLHGLLEYPR